jgi:hypothetical protein
MSESEENFEGKANRVIEETDDLVILDERGGHYLRVTRKEIGAFVFIIIDWNHPNFGYFADCMFWWSSLHSDWKSVCVASWTQKYKGNKLYDFFKDYPELIKMFEKKISPLEYMMSNALEKFVKKEASG